MFIVNKNICNNSSWTYHHFSAVTPFTVRVMLIKPE